MSPVVQYSLKHLQSDSKPVWHLQLDISLWVRCATSDASGILDAASTNRIE